MAREIHIDSISEDNRKKLTEELSIKIDPSSFTPKAQPTYIYPYDVISIGGEDYGYIPFAYGGEDECPGGPYPRSLKENFSTREYKFVGSLRDHQKQVKTEAIDHLNKYGSTVISCYPGYGKTCSSIYIASKIRMKTLVITHRIVLVNQWRDSINKFCPDATVQILDSKCKKTDCDFYIMNAINIPKRDRNDYKDIGFLIVDEIHCIMSEVLSKCMCCIVPRFLLGLSATPYREDGLNILIDLYFGKRKIHRKLYRKHTVYKINTNFKPTIEQTSNGRLNWGVILDSQALDKDRNNMIISIVKYFPKRVFIILCKRVEQGNYLVNTLKEQGEDVTSLIGKQQEYEQKSRILVGTASKTGTGFDHPRLDAMILACDLQAYFQQYMGRVCRTETVVPIIFDIVDKNPILEKHFQVRKTAYIEHGGVIKDFSKEFPDFN
jgi:superfamily II DNA or RNA helicase